MKTNLKKDSIENQLKEAKITKYSKKDVEELIKKWNQHAPTCYIKYETLQRYTDNDTNAYRHLRSSLV